MSVSYGKFYLITPDYKENKSNFALALESSLKNGIELVQLRSKNLNLNDYKALAKDMTPLAHQYGAKIILNGPANLLEDIDADGIHFPSSAIADQNIRPIPKNFILSIACHNLEQIKIANAVSTDIGVLCPVFATPSSPKGIPIGWEKFAEIVKFAEFPVYALGGLTINDYGQAIACGAHGIGAKRGFWNLHSKILD